MMIVEADCISQGPPCRPQIVEEPPGHRNSGDSQTRVARVRRRERVSPHLKDGGCDLRRLHDNILVGGEDGIRHDERVERLAESPGRERPRTREILSSEDQQVHVPIELKVLKAIVEDMDRASQVVLGKTPGQIPIGRREDRDAGKLAREHERFVSRPVEICPHAVGIADDDHSVTSIAARVAAAENGGPLPHFEEHPRDTRRHRRFPTPPDSQVADAHDGISQAPAEIGAPRVTLTPSSRCRRVQGAQQRVIKRTFETAPRPLRHLRA
jgi:hypothetical protein